MVKKILCAAAAVALLAGLWAHYRANRPERRILKACDRLCNLFSKEADESGATMALKMNALPGLFADTCDVELDNFRANGSYSNSEIASHVSRIRPSFKRMSLTFHNPVIEVLDVEAGDAQVVLTARLDLVAKSGPEERLVREIRCFLVFNGDDWVFRRFSEQAVLER